MLQWRHGKAGMVLASLVALLWLAPGAFSCNVPVFRYALERWAPDPYDIIVFHDGNLSSSDQALIQSLKTQEEKGSANFLLHEIDIKDPEVDEFAVRLYKEQKPTSMPWVVVQFPRASRQQGTAWAGPLSQENIDKVFDSPARREVIRRVMKGDSVVYILIESGDKQQDDAAAKMIEAAAKELPKVLKLPELTDAPEDQLLAEQGPPLKIAFSLIRVSRQDPAEKMLVNMLLHSEDDLYDRNVNPLFVTSLAGHMGSPASAALVGACGYHLQQRRVEPILFPVFGRGRSLLALLGKGISQKLLAEDGEFLTGPCSCTVKRQNPGFDLLMTADWEGLLGGKVVMKPENPPTSEPPKTPDNSLVGISSLGDPKNDNTDAKAKIVPPAPTSDGPQAQSRSNLLYNLLVVGGIGIVILIAGSVIVTTKSKPVKTNEKMASS